MVGIFAKSGNILILCINSHRRTDNSRLKQRCCLSVYYLQIIFFSRIESLSLFQLQHLTFCQILKTLGEAKNDTLIALSYYGLYGSGEPKITDQNGCCRGVESLNGRCPATEIRVIGNIIMKQSGGMQHL